MFARTNKAHRVNSKLDYSNFYKIDGFGLGHETWQKDKVAPCCIGCYGFETRK